MMRVIAVEDGNRSKLFSGVTGTSRSAVSWSKSISVEASSAGSGAPSIRERKPCGSRSTTRTR